MSKATALSSSRAERKLQRKAHQSVFEPSARFWKDTTVPKFELGVQAINQAASIGLSGRTEAKNTHTLYLVRFKLRQSKNTFIKVGITSRSVETRFEKDIPNYEVFILRTISGLSIKQALLLEKRVLVKFQKTIYYPNVRLMSGNTECMDPTLESRIVTYFDLRIIHSGTPVIGETKTL